MLNEQLEETVALLEGSRIDGELYARLSADDADLVRAALRDGAEVELDDDSSDDELGAGFDPRAEAEEEILRLQGELEHSARTQSALERYLAALTVRDPGAPTDPKA